MISPAAGAGVNPFAGDAPPAVAAQCMNARPGTAAPAAPGAAGEARGHGLGTRHRRRPEPHSPGRHRAHTSRNDGANSSGRAATHASISAGVNQPSSLTSSGCPRTGPSCRQR